MTTDADKKVAVRWLSGILPFVCLGIYIMVPEEPQQLVLISGMVQALMLPMLAGAALFFRYQRGDARVAPGKVWDVFLWISSVGMLFAAGCLVYKSANGYLDYLKKQQTEPPPAKAASLIPPAEPVSRTAPRS